MEDSKVSVILDAARKRFAHYGLAKTTMNEIAADIGMSKASLYYYFPDKERIFVAVVEQEFAEFVTMIEDVIDRPSKPSFKLKKYISLRNKTLEKLRNLAKVERPSPTEYFNPLFDELKEKFMARERALVARILQLGIDEKYFTKFPVDQYADLFLSTLLGLRLTLVSNRQTDVTEEKVSAQSLLFVEIFLQAITSDASTN